MTMDNTEIINTYRAAKDPKKQIQVLAELNQCGIEKIVDILTEAGEKVDKRWFSKPPKATAGAGSNPARRGEEPATLSLSFTRAEIVSLVRFLSDALPVYLREADLSMEAIHGLTGAYLRLKGVAK